MAVSAAGAMSLKRSFSSLDLAADARAARARRSALRRRAQPSNKEGLEDPTLETPLRVFFSLKGHKSSSLSSRSTHRWTYSLRLGDTLNRNQDG